MREKLAAELFENVVEGEEFDRVYNEFLLSGGMRGLSQRRVCAMFYAVGIERGACLESSEDGDCTKSNESNGRFFK